MANDPASYYRYERKYQTHLSTQEIANFLSLNSLIFRPIYARRKVNSLYFDTPQLEYFHQNQAGDAQRKKVRVRWYGEQKNPTTLQIEIKSREGELIKKDTAVFAIKGKWSTTGVTDLVRETLSAVLPEAHTLVPTLTNSYWRSYFVAEQSGLRVTIDDDLLFNNLLIPGTIVECKYATAADTVLQSFIQQLPLYVSKSSKYVMGMQQLSYAD